MQFLGIDHLSDDVRTALFCIFLVLTLLAVLAFLILLPLALWRLVKLALSAQNRQDSAVRRALLTVAAAVLSPCLAVFLLTFALRFSALYSRDYLPDLVLELPESDTTLVIKEWTLFIDSGAELYRRDGKRLTLIDKDLRGGDDGYCPFESGDYVLTENPDGSFTLRWIRYYDEESGTTRYWYEETYYPQ